MDFELGEIEALVQQSARSFTAKRVTPSAVAIEEGGVPKALMGELAELGLMAVNVPDELGGAGAGVVAYSLAMMEVAKGCASVAVTMAVNNMVGEVIASFGSEEQKKHYNPLLATGGLGSFALSEVDAGSDPGALRTKAERTATGYVINGNKQWISHADTADVLVVWARTGDAGPKGLTCFLVDMAHPGVSVTGKEHKMGLGGSHTCSLSLENVDVPESARLGEEGRGFQIGMMALDGGRIGVASQALGIAEAAQAAAVSYSKERKTFGKAISEHQAIQWMIADSRTELDAGRLLTLRAAFLKQNGAAFGKQAAMAKLYSTEAAWRACDRALQVHGGYGYTKEFPVERHLRDVRVTRIYEGTSEIQRLVISRSVLRE